MPTVDGPNQISLEDKLFTVHRKKLTESHIKINEPFCRECRKRACTYICPAQVYVWNEGENRIDARYEDCLECGACRVVCESIEWSNPVWSEGISYKSS